MSGIASNGTERRDSEPLANRPSAQNQKLAGLPKWLRTAPIFNTDPLSAARALRPLIEAGAAEGDRSGHMPEPVIRGIAEAGLWGLFVPREFGGIEADPETYISTIEELSYADGSTGWVLMATTFGISGAALWLGPSAIDAIFNQRSDWDGYICAGQVAPTGKAERVPGGYRASGQFQFGSGSDVAGWFFGAFVIHENGKPKLAPSGGPEVIFAFAPRRNVRIKPDSWDVMGLRATASVDYEIVDQFIHDDFVMFPANRPRRGGPVYEIGVSLAHVSWALGVGMRVLDEIKDLASRKRRPNRVTLIDQPTFQRDFAEAAGTLEAARAFVRSTFKNWYEASKQGKPSLEVKTQARLASCLATQVAASVGRFAHLAAGSDGARNNEGNNRLQRCFRDLQVGCTHKHVDYNVLIECGTVLLGVNSPQLQL